MSTATAASEIALPPHPRDELKSLALEADQFYASDDWKNADAPTRQKYLDRSAEVFDEAFKSAESSLDEAEADSFYNSTTAFLQGKMAEHNNRDADEKRRRAAADKSMQVFTERQKVTPDQVRGVVNQSLEVAGGMSAQTRGSGVMKLDGEQGKPSIGVQPLDWTPSAEEFWKSHYDLTASEAEKKSAKDFARSKGKDSLADDILYRSAVAGEESAKLAARDLAFSKGEDAAGVAAAEREATLTHRRNAKLTAIESTQSSAGNPKGRKLPFRVVRTNGMLNIEPDEGKAEEAMMAAERMGLLTSEEAARLIPSGVEMDKEFASRPKAQGGIVTAVKEFGSSILPALGTAAGTAIGAAASKGDISTAMVGGASGGSAALWMQKKVFGEVDQAQREANARAHPGWAQVGSFVPFLVSMFQKTPPAITTAGRMAQTAKVALTPGTAAARWESALQSGIAMGRAGFSSGVQQRYVEGNKDVNPIDEGVRSFIAGGAMGILKPAKSILMAMTGKAVKDAAAVTFAEGLYDLAVHNKPIDFKAIAAEAPGTFTAFALQNAVMGLFHKFAAAPEARRARAFENYRMARERQDAKLRSGEWGFDAYNEAVTKLDEVFTAKIKSEKDKEAFLEHAAIYAARHKAAQAATQAAEVHAKAANDAEQQAQRFSDQGYPESAAEARKLAQTHRAAMEKAYADAYAANYLAAQSVADAKIAVEQAAPAPHPIIAQIDSVVAAHASELSALEHPLEFVLVTIPDESGGGGFHFNQKTGKIEYDPVRIEKVTIGMTPRQLAKYIRRGIAEEIIHVATDKYASESPENQAKLLAILGDAEAVAAAEKAYGKNAFEKLNETQKAFEVARVLIQGPRALTEAAYRFFKDLLRWLAQKVKNLSPETKELLDGIKAKMEAHKSGKVEEAEAARVSDDEMSKRRTPLPQKDRRSLQDRAEEAVARLAGPERAHAERRLESIARDHNQIRREYADAKTVGEKLRLEMEMVEVENRWRKISGETEIEINHAVTADDIKKDAERLYYREQEIEAKLKNGEAITPQDRQDWKIAGRKSEELPKAIQEGAPGDANYKPEPAKESEPKNEKAQSVPSVQKADESVRLPQAEVAPTAPPPEPATPAASHAQTAKEWESANKRKLPQNRAPIPESLSLPVGTVVRAKNYAGEGDIVITGPLQVNTNGIIEYPANFTGSGRMAAVEANQITEIKPAAAKPVEQPAPSTPDWIATSAQSVADSTSPLVRGQIADLSAQRLTAKEIAGRLGITEDTVRLVRVADGIPPWTNSTNQAGGQIESPEFTAWLAARKSKDTQPAAAPAAEQPAPQKSFRQLMDEQDAKDRAMLEKAEKEGRIGEIAGYTPAVQLPDGRVVESKSNKEGHGELAALFPDQKVIRGFVNNDTKKFMSAMEVARERMKPAPAPVAAPTKGRAETVETLADSHGADWIYKNGNITKPGFNAKWTPEEKSAMEQRFKAAGFRIGRMNNSTGETLKSSFKIDSESKAKLDTVLDQREMAAKQAKKDADAQKKKDADAATLAATDQSALAWLNKTFGEQFANAFNKASLADFISGKESKFKGLPQPQWERGLRAIGALDGNTINYAKIKESYEQNNQAAANRPAKGVGQEVVQDEKAPQASKAGASSNVAPQAEGGIFGYAWADIRSKQQGGKLAALIRGAAVKPKATEADLKLLESKGAEWLYDNEKFGIIDRLGLPVDKPSKKAEVKPAAIPKIIDVTETPGAQVSGPRLAIKLDDGTIIHSADAGIHAVLAARAGIDPSRIVDTGFYGVLSGEFKGGKTTTAPTKSTLAPSPVSEAAKLRAKLVEGATVEVTLRRGSGAVHPAKLTNVDTERGVATVEFKKSKSKKHGPFKGGETQDVRLDQVAPLKSVRTRMLNEAQFEGMTEDQKRQTKADAKEFDNLVADHPEMNWYNWRVNDLAGTKSGDMDIAAERKRASEEAMEALGGDPTWIHKDNSVMKAELLPKLKAMIEEKAHEMAREIPEDSLPDDTDFLPPGETPEPVAPKLRPSDGKGTGELLQGDAAPFNLVAETAADIAKREAREAAEQVAKDAKDAAEAKAKQDKEQGNLFGVATPRMGQELADKADALGIPLKTEQIKKLIADDPDTLREVRARIDRETGGDQAGMVRTANPLENRDERSAPFYSALTKTVQNLPQETMTVQQARAAIEKGAKKDEIAMSGILTDPLSPLAGKQPGDKVTKAELTGYALERQATVQDVVLGQPLGDKVKKSAQDAVPFSRQGFDGWIIPDANGDVMFAGSTKQDAADRWNDAWRPTDTPTQTHFSQYQLPGADKGSYREMFVTMPDVVIQAKPGAEFEDWKRQATIKYGTGWKRHDLTEWERKKYDEYEKPTFWQDGHAQYGSILNPIVRIRRNIRTMPKESRAGLGISESTNPDGGREQLQNLLRGNDAALSALNGVNPFVLRVIQNDKVRSAVVSNLPVDVVNMLAAKKLSPNDLFGKKTMADMGLTGDSGMKVGVGLVEALRKTGASARAKVLESLLRGNNQEILPAVQASDLSAAEVRMILSAKGVNASEASPAFATVPKSGATGEGARLGNLVGSSGEGLPAPLAELLDSHDSIVKQNKEEMQGTSRIYMIEEMQGPGKGEQEKMPPELRKRIYEIGMKRALRDAVDEGADAIAWTTGAQQIDRYEEALRQNIDRLEYEPYQGDDGKPLYEINGVKAGKDVFKEEDVTPERLAELVGKDLAAKIEQGVGTSLKEERPLRPAWMAIEGKDLSIGGQGLKRLYDATLPGIANDLAKKFGVKAGTAEIRGGEKYILIEEPSGVGNAFVLRNKDTGKYLADSKQETWALRPEDGELMSESVARKLANRFAQVSAPETVHSLPIPDALKTQQRGGNTIFTANPADSLRETSTKNAVVDEERAKLGLDPIMSEIRQSHPVVWDAAMRALERDPMAGHNLVNEINGRPRALTATEEAIILRHKINTQTAFYREMEVANDGNASPQDRMSAKLYAAQHLDAMNDIDNATRKSGTEWGRLGAFRQRLAREDYTLVAMLRKRSMATGERIEPGGAEYQFVEKLNKRIAELEAKATQDARNHAAELEQLRETAMEDAMQKMRSDGTPAQKKEREILARIAANMESAKENADAALREMGFGPVANAAGPSGNIIGTANPQDANTLDPKVLKLLSVGGANHLRKLGNDRAKWDEAMLSNYGPKVQPHLDAVWDVSQATLNDFIDGQAPKETRENTKKKILTDAEKQKRILDSIRRKSATPDKVAPYLKQLAKQLVSQGVSDRWTLLTTMETMLKDILPDATRSEIRDSLADYGEGKYRELSTDEVSVKMRRLRAQLQQEAKIEDMMRRGELPWLIGSERGEPDAETRTMIKEVNEIKKELGLEATNENQGKSARAAIKTRLRNEIEELEKFIKTRERIPSNRRSVEDDPETAQLRRDVRELRAKYQEIVGVDTMAEEAAKESALEKSIADLQNQIVTGEIEQAAKQQTVDTPEIAALKAQKAALLEQRKALRSPSTEDIERKKEQDLLDRITKLSLKIATGVADAKVGKSTVESANVSAYRDIIKDLNKQLAEIRNPKKSPDQTKLDELDKRIAEVSAKIARGDLSTKQGKPTVDTAEQAVRKDTLRALNKQLADMRKAAKPTLTPDEIALKTWKTRAEKRLIDLKDRTARGDFSKKVRKVMPMDTEALKTKAALEAAKLEFDQANHKAMTANAPWWVKTMDVAQKYRRWAVLTSATVFEKLGMAAVWRTLVLQPIEDAVGSIIRHISYIKPVAVMAPRHGQGFNTRIQLDGLINGFASGASEAATHLKKAGNLLTGSKALSWLFGEMDEAKRLTQTPIEALSGKRKVEPDTAWEIPGVLHAVVKDIPKMVEFHKSVAFRTKWYADRGVDVSDPLMQEKIQIESFQDAMRAISMQENAVLNKLNRFIRSLGEPDVKTGKVNKWGKVWQTAFKVAFPIVKIPTNIVAEAFEYVVGLPAGLLNVRKVRKAIKDGITNLPPEHADMIMRQLKKGLVGNAILLTGFLLASNIGGYFQHGRKRDPDEVPAGGIRIGDTTVHERALHAPALLILQAGATIARVMNSRMRKSDVDEQGMGAGLVAAALGLADEIPFVKEAFNLSALRNPYQKSHWFGAKARSIVEPTLMQWIAKLRDTDEEGNPIKRQADGFVDEMKMGIPGLRETLDVKQEKVPHARSHRR